MAAMTFVDLVRHWRGTDHDPAAVAELDQLASTFKDTLAGKGVDLEDEAQRRAVLVSCEAFFALTRPGDPVELMWGKAVAAFVSIALATAVLEGR